MALFKINNQQAQKLGIQQFNNERELQRLFESNLEKILEIRFLASEFTTTNSGRIDTLGLDEDGNPVIIEYKANEQDNVINQGLFYLDWLVDHRGDFEQLVRNKLGEHVRVIWDTPRLILVAQSYNRYDKYAVNRISERIELKTYTFYENDLLFVEDVVLPNERVNKERRTNIVYNEYTIEDHLRNKPDKIQKLFKELQEKILTLDDKINEKVLRQYVAYELNSNFASIILQKGSLKVYVNIDKEKVIDPRNKLEDVSEKGHWGTGNLSMKIENFEDIDYCMDIVKQSYESKL